MCWKLSARVNQHLYNIKLKSAKTALTEHAAMTNLKFTTEDVNNVVTESNYHERKNEFSCYIHKLDPINWYGEEKVWLLLLIKYVKQARFQMMRYQKNGRYHSNFNLINI